MQVVRPAWLAGKALIPPAEEAALEEELETLLDAEALDDADALDADEELELAGAVVGRTVGAGVGAG